MSNLTLDPTIDQTPEKNNSFARRGALAFTSLLAAGALAFSGASAAHAAPIDEGEFDFISATSVGTNWELRSFDHETDTPLPIPVDGWEVPANQNGLIPADETPGFDLYGGGLRNETGVSGQLSLVDVIYSGSDESNASVEIGNRYEWDSVNGVTQDVTTPFGPSYHEHFDWQFGTEGGYTLIFEVSGGGLTSDTAAYDFTVN
ncbi:MAG: hypothetical protein ACTMIR_01025 [Cellulomonadaceae bacterium]